MNNKRDMRERKQVDHLVNIGDQVINLPRTEWSGGTIGTHSACGRHTWIKLITFIIIFAMFNNLRPF